MLILFWMKIYISENNKLLFQVYIKYNIALKNDKNNLQLKNKKCRKYFSVQIKDRIL